MRPEAICGAPTDSVRTLDWAKRTMPCWKVTARRTESCAMERMPVARSRRSWTKMAATGFSESGRSSAGCAPCAPV